MSGTVFLVNVSPRVFPIIIIGVSGLNLGAFSVVMAGFTVSHWLID